MKKYLILFVSRRLEFFKECNGKDRSRLIKDLRFGKWVVFLFRDDFNLKNL